MLDGQTLSSPLSIPVTFWTYPPPVIVLPVDIWCVCSEQRRPPILLLQLWQWSCALTALNNEEINADPAIN